MRTAGRVGVRLKHLCFVKTLSVCYSGDVMSENQTGNSMQTKYIDCLHPHGLWSAEVIPFPLVRRRDFIIRHAHRMAELREAGAENHLRHQLRVQADVLARRGVLPEVIEEQVSAVEVATRVELARLQATYGGAA